MLGIRGDNGLFIIEGVGVVAGARSSDDGDCYTVHPKDLDMPNAIFDRPDLSAFTGLDDLGLEVTGQRIEPDHGSVGVPYYR